MTGRSLFVSVLVLITFAHLALALWLPPAADELYYWTWAQSLQWSYYDHPPMTALWLWVSTGVFGDNLFAIRLPAVLATTGTLAMLGLVMRRKRLLYLLALTPMVGVFSIVMTPDIPLLFFWTAYFLWAIKLNEQYQTWDADPVTRVYHQMPVTLAMWGVGGILLGLGILSKYTMALAPGCLALLFIVHYPVRGWWKGALVHAFAAAIVAAPILLYNLETDFLPVKFQWAHSMGGSGLSLSQWFEFLGVQGLLVGTLPFLLLPWVAGQAKRLTRRPLSQVALYFYLPPLSFFLIQALRSRLEGNWALVAYISFWPLAQAFFERSSFSLVNRGLLVLGFVPPITTAALILIHASTPLGSVPPEKDRINLLRVQIAASELIAKDVAEQSIPTPVFAPTYQWTSYLRYQGVPAEQTYPGGRPSHFTMTPTPVCMEQQVTVLQDAHHPEPALNCFHFKEVLREYPLQVRGKERLLLQLARYSKVRPDEEPPPP